MTQSLIISLYNSVKDAIFPSRCLACGYLFHQEKQDKEPKIEDTNFKSLMTPFLCELCRDDFFSIESPLCIGCGVMFISRAGTDHLCEECITAPKKFRKARAPGVFKSALRKTIHSFKYKGKTGLAKPLGLLLYYSFMQFWENERIDMVIPVPLHAKRLKKRGFNQSYLLIKDWMDQAGKNSDQSKKITIAGAAIKRIKRTRPQTGLDRKRRIENIKDAFKLGDGENVREKKILIVDDVYTTGATANECAKVLLKKGATSVDVLTLARAM